MMGKAIFPQENAPICIIFFIVFSASHSTIGSSCVFNIIRDQVRKISVPTVVPSAFIEEFHSRLLSTNSATLVMEAWWGSPLVAHKVSVRVKPLTIDQKHRLCVEDDHDVIHRYTHLYCGRTMVAEADSWYRPDCLTEAMCSALLSTECPIGRIISPLNPVRQTFYTTRSSPPFALEHRSLLLTDCGQPFCEVHERFKAPSQPPSS